MPRYLHHQINWSWFLADLEAFREQRQLSRTRLARLLHISPSALTLYLQGQRRPTAEIFAFAALLMNRGLSDYCGPAPTPNGVGR